MQTVLQYSAAARSSTTCIIIRSDWYESEETAGEAVHFEEGVKKTYPKYTVASIRVK